MSLPPSSQLALRDAAVDWAFSHGLVYRALKDGKVLSGFVNHAPFSLVPTPFPKKSFDRVKDLQTLWNVLIHRIAHDQEFLDGVMSSLAKVDEFTGRLYQLYLEARTDICQPLSLGLLRNDYMVHSTSEDKLYQVEINTIASSFSSHSTKVNQMHHYLFQRFPNLVEDIKGIVPENTSLYSIPHGLSLAHKAYLEQFQPKSSPVILMICQHPERNAFDQRWIEDELWTKHKIVLVRRTLTQVAKIAKLDGKRLLLSIPDQTCQPNVPGSAEPAQQEGLSNPLEISVIYFRAGYTPVDFPTEDEWQARLLLEKSRAIKSPTLAYHLTGTKKVQQVLSQPGVLERFLPKECMVGSLKISSQAPQLLRQVMTGLYPLDGKSKESQDAIEKCLKDPEEFVMKPQREGGGNNIYGSDIPPLLNSLSTDQRDAYILMDRIRPPHHQVYLVKEGECHEADALSELGIYGIFLAHTTKRQGNDWQDGQILYNDQGGWLLRTKRSDSNEGGVAAGFAVLDSPLLV